MATDAHGLTRIKRTWEGLCRGSFGVEGEHFGVGGVSEEFGEAAPADDGFEKLFDIFGGKQHGKFLENEVFADLLVGGFFDDFEYEFEGV